MKEAMIRRFNNEGHNIFKKFIFDIKASKDANEVDIPDYMLFDDNYTELIDPNIKLEKNNFINRYDFGKSLFENLSKAKTKDINYDNLFWDWVVLFYFEDLEFGSGGKQTERFLLSNDWRYQIRHLARMPWYMVSIYRDRISWLLQKEPNVHSQFIEQIFKRNWMGQNINVINLCKKLYFSETKKQIKKSCDRLRHDGGILRLCSEINQLGVIYNIVEMSDESIKKILPEEFLVWEEIQK